MKIRGVVVALGLLMFVFCTADLSQSAISPKYNIFLVPPNDHPWQHDGSPGNQDGSDHSLVRMVILPVSPTIRAILLIRTPRGITGSVKEAKEASPSERDKHYFQGRR